MTGEVLIYALYDDTGIRYVGQTTRSLESRLAAHLAENRRNPEKVAWIRELRTLGLQPHIELLDVTDRRGANAAERAYIREARRQGCRLLNGKQGGSRARPVPDAHVRLVFRLPPDLAREIKEMARRDGRSWNAQVVHAVRWYVNVRGAADAAKGAV